jgi:hypothetical protein
LNDVLRRRVGGILDESDRLCQARNVRDAPKLREGLLAVKNEKQTGNGDIYLINGSDQTRLTALATIRTT